MPVLVFNMEEVSRIEQEENFKNILNFICTDDFDVVIELVRLVAEQLVYRIDIESNGEIHVSESKDLPCTTYPAITIKNGSILDGEFVEIWLRRKVDKLQFEKFKKKLAMTR